METLYNAAVVIKDYNPYLMAGLWITALAATGYGWLGGNKIPVSEKTDKVLDQVAAGFAITVMVSSAIYPLCHFLVK